MPLQIVGSNGAGVMNELQVWTGGTIGLYPVPDPGPIILTVPEGGNQTGIADLGGRSLVALHMSGDWDGGNLYVSAAPTTSDPFRSIYTSDTGTELTITGGANRVIGLVGSHLQAVAALRYIKLSCDIIVAAEQTITLIVKG